MEDLAFKYGIIQNTLPTPIIHVPTKKDNLFVLRPIDKYEPMIEKKSHAFSHDPNSKIKKKLNSEPKSQIDIRECHLELTGEMLQKIFASPKKIDFGSIYSKASVTKTFGIRNDLRTSIIVQLFVENEELKGTDLKPQVIPSSQNTAFEVSFSSKTFPLQFKGTVKYVINHKHSFFFEVCAQVDPVKLELATKSLKFSFNENNKEMFTREKLRIKNEGNAPGKFKWTDFKNFEPDPKEGKVLPKDYFDCWIYYTPSGNTNNRFEEEKLFLKVKDGADQLLRFFY